MLHTSELVVVKIYAGLGNPFRDLVVVIWKGVVTLCVPELVFVVFLLQTGFPEAVTGVILRGRPIASSKYKFFCRPCFLCVRD